MSKAQAPVTSRPLLDESATAAAAAQLVALVESSGDAIIGLTLAGTIVSWNRGAAALYGYSAGEALNRPVDMLLPHESRGTGTRLLLPVIRGERHERVDTVHESKDGRRHDVSLTISPVRDAGGRLLGMSMIARDVSVQKRSEDDLRRMSRYFELSRDMVCTAGLDGYLKQLNGTWTETLGWTDVELRARPMLDFVHPDDRPATLTERGRLPRNGATVAFVNRYATKDGGWRWLDWNTRFDPEEQLIYAAARDVTDRKAAEAQAQFQSRLLDAVGEAVITTDLTGTITYWGPGAETLYGWSSSQTLGRSIVDVIPAIPAPDPVQVAEIISRLARGQPYTGIMRLGRSDGSSFLAEVTDTPVLDAAGAMVAVIGISTDVSAREEAHAEVERARDQALEASVLKSHFLANMSHEIRTPMNGVLGMTELLLDTKLDARQRDYAETVRSSGNVLLAIIDDILDLSKIEAGRLELEAIDFDLPAVIEDVAELLAPAAQARGIELVVDIGGDVPAVSGDPGRFRQVLTNLVGNAVKFTPAGHVVVTARVISVSAGGPTVRIEVEDTGIGIDPEVVATIFEPFAQAETSTNRRYGGTGLGLAITRELIDLMGGDCGLDSVRGAGSTFWLTVELPWASAGRRSVEHGLADLRGMRALVVDDDPTNRDVLGRQLSDWGIDVEVAGSGPAAMELARTASAREAPFTVVVCDVQMPGMDGVELADNLAAEPGTARTPIVLLTSAGDDQRSQRHRPVAVAAELAKPVRHGRLRRCLAGLGAAPAIGPGEDATAPVPSPAGGVHRGRVLLAEDNPINQKVAVAMLEAGGYTVDVASDGRQAVGAVRARHYEVVLMDCQMPEMDGYEATTAIRSGKGASRLTPIVAMTAGAMQEDRDRAQAAGMDDYLAKPVTKSEVLAAVAKWAGRSADVAGGR